MKKITTLFALFLLIQFASCSKDNAIVNTAPIIKEQTFKVKENEIITLKIIATDLEDDALTFSIKKDDSNFFMISEDGTLRVKPETKKLVEDKFIIEVEVSDTNLKASAIITINIESVF
ncbi:Ig-like domain-containing protein [uncultured Tenacibaculum sp.]|uniref:Ig-like domain-containing protein n=1 Tax=uncultured Tenacibaculum sp. TaxID=174713 RepID=UPI00261E48F4|nr:Ig-like domain-containing protein [uncultured Tenacibaculum sp.]